VPRYVAFLRAINVTGRFLKMAELAGHFHALGYVDACTFLNSGNVVFSSQTRNATKLAAAIESGLEPLLGFKSEVFLRTDGDVSRVVTRGRSYRSKVSPDGEVNVAFLAENPTEDHVAVLNGLRTERDVLIAEGREIYWLCEGRQSESTIGNGLLERKLKMRMTLRRVSSLDGLAGYLLAAGSGG